MQLKSLIRSIIPKSVLNVYHLCRAVLAASLAGFPGRKLRIFGVTGTNGKTTTALFLHSILTERRLKTGLMSTVRFSDGIKMWRNDLKMGTLDSFKLQFLLRKMIGRGATEAIIEVTSHGLVQERVWGIPFDTVIFTNLTVDHLDYHPTKASYRGAKERLFARPHRVSVVNGDDPAAAEFLKYPAVRRLTYSLKNSTDVWASDIRDRQLKTHFVLHAGNEALSINLNLLGRFNVENALAAAAAALGANIDLETIKQGLERLQTSPGRMEFLNHGQSYQIILDYAHTPDGLKKVFETVRSDIKGRLIHVGGATGDRYKEKRPLLGALAGRYADIVIVTDEDPGSEDPAAIIQAVVSGVQKGAGRAKYFEHDRNFFTILRRDEAIRKALNLARVDDVVLITGKGDEEVMAVKSGHIPFSDRKVVEQALASRETR